MPRLTHVPISILTCTRLSLSKVRLSMRFQFININNWASPRSLATTCGVSVDFLSSGYLDVSVRRVRFINLCIQLMIPYLYGGLPHSDTHGSKTALVSPWLFAECHVLLRLLVPRHPLDALNYLNYQTHDLNHTPDISFNSSFLYINISTNINKIQSIQYLSL